MRHGSEKEINEFIKTRMATVIGLFDQYRAYLYDLQTISERLIRDYSRSIMIARSMKSEISDLQACLARILAELPTNRDWLDPELEHEARDLLKKGKE